MKYFLLLSILGSPIFINAQTIKELFCGTTIITVITKDSIVIAGDSRLSNMQNPLMGDTVYKIGIRENIAYSIAGEFVTIKDSTHTLYNAYELIDSLIGVYKNIDSISSHFIDISLSVLNAFIGQIIVYYVDRWAAIFQNRVMEIQLSTFENGIPKYKVSQIGFGVKEKYFFVISGDTLGLTNLGGASIDYSWPLVNIPRDDSINRMPSMRFIGLYKEIETHIDSVTIKWDNIFNTLRGLIKIEISTYPYLVGEPIRILVLYRNKKHKWVN